MGKAVLVLRGITKIYDGGTVANHNIDLSLEAGEIHGLVGQNGSGKTTLMKILFGQLQPTEGEIFVHGQRTVLQSPKKALGLGIAMVHQQFALVDSMTSAENITLGRRGRISSGQAEKFTVELCQKWGLEVNPTKKVRDMSVGEKQKTELLRALGKGAEILILDEPTATLTAQERTRLFAELKRLKSMGKSIIFISHRLSELGELCDRVTVLRGGESCGTFSEVQSDKLIGLIMGENFPKQTEKEVGSQQKNSAKTKLLTLENIQGGGLKNISLTVESGEILGLAGAEDSGRRALTEILCGQVPTMGKLEFLGEEISSAQLAKEVGYIPEDCAKTGLAQGGTVAENLIAGRQSCGKFSKHGLLKKKAMADFTAECTKKLELSCANGEQLAGSLSGGNMQKLVAAREFADSPRLLVAVEPTRGLDIKAGAMVHELMNELCEKGSGVVVSSGDIMELRELCHRLIIMYDGEIAAEIIDPSHADETELGGYLLGTVKKTTQRESHSHEEN